MNAPVDIALRVTGLNTRIDASAGVVHPLDGVDLAIRKGETFAIVGESGCGKSMTALSIMRLLPRSSVDRFGQCGTRRCERVDPARVQHA